MTSATLRAEEPVEHLLKAVELALLDVTTGFKSISEDGRTRTVHQRLPRHLHLATRAAQYVAQDLPRMSPPGACCGWPPPAGPACPGMGISTGPITTGLRRPS